jgi:chemotaxis response regulator CheB
VLIGTSTGDPNALQTIISALPGDQHLLLRQVGQVGLSKEPTESLHCPSVDVLMHSGAEIYGQRALAVIMTGMGEDGASGVGGGQKNPPHTK